MMQDFLEKAAIGELVHRYATMVDTFRLEETLDCWTDDAVFDETDTGFGTFSGREELRHFFQDQVFSRHRLLIHLTGNHLVTLGEKGRASGTAFVMAESIRLDGVRSRMIAMYEDEYIKGADGVWRFSRRTMRRAFPREYSHLTPPPEQA